MNARTPLSKLLEAILGANPADTSFLHPRKEPGEPAEAPLLTPGVSARRGTRPLTRNEIVLDALKRALADFMSSEARAYVGYYPSTRFMLEQITVIQTPDNARYLRDLAAIKRKIRNGIGEACIGEVDPKGEVLDRTRFCDWNIGPAADASADDQSVYTVVAGNGPEQITLDFIFYGDYDEVDPAAAQASAPLVESRNHLDQLADQTPTLDPGPATAALVRLQIHEPSRPVRSLTAHETPVLIGRGSACGVQLASPYTSRIHASIRLDRTGALVIENNSTRGTQLHDGKTTTAIELAKAIPLPRTGSIILTPKAGEDAVRIDFERLSHTASTPAPDDGSMPTIEVPGSTPQPASVPQTARASSDASGFVYLGAGSQPTLYQPEPALAHVIVCHSDGRTETVPIRKVPFVIGREPQSDSAVTVHDASCRVSREHLRIERAQGGGFITENLACGGGKGGTWLKGEALGHRFAWRPEPAGSNTGWHVLGQRTEGAGAVMVKLERA